MNITTIEAVVSADLGLSRAELFHLKTIVGHYVAACSSRGGDEPVYQFADQLWCQLKDTLAVS